ncbi:MAG: DNA polymerase III subunit alpha [Patescibacteria group bacterium]|nr:DNA polymerase III subunit alpha [bacterium]MDZ4240600.1 DNA polymerase III subunit alpha [Patescibacteria group bacterium]
MSSFVHLHTHSHYSLLTGLPKIKNLVSETKKLGMDAIALTDNGNLYGAVEFYKECKKAGIKPIIGVDTYVAARSRHDKEATLDSVRTRIVLLAKNLTGYKNLLKLVTLSYLEGFYYKPRLDRELMERYAEGLICISPSFRGDIALSAISKNFDKAKKSAAWHIKTFGKENFFIEITHHPEIDGHAEKMKFLQIFAKELGIPLVAAHDVYYLKAQDKKVRDTMMSIQMNKETHFNDVEDFSLIDSDTAARYFADIPEAVINTKKISEMCNLELELGKWVFPAVQLPEGKTHDDMLRDIVVEGLERKKMEKTKEVEERIEYELGIIRKKGYAPYFLVVWDLMEYAHEKNILTTIRGSVAGSLVTFLAGITNVNPLEYKLPFERFLNPERPSPPDIDMDFADNRRDEMIDYARRKYGEDKVAQIGTFGTMMARAAVRDVARALGYSYGVGDRIAKLIPFGSQGFPMTIDHALEITPELKSSYGNDADTRTILDMARAIEGCARHISVHAAGVVISPTPLTDFVPLQFDPKGGKLITQYDMHSVEDAGLLKFDFLGIRNLSILAYAVELVAELKGVKVDIENIPLDDKKTFEMLARGETIGLFQLNGAGMTRYLKELRATTIHDINAMVALYRPGPLESIPLYIERKHNSKLVSYLDPRLKDILSQSHGVITYQDDVLLIAINLAGYSWLEADKLRKAMGKKIPAEMEAQKEKLLSGFIKNGMTKEKAEKLWKLIEPFAAYGFNKAHAASYGKVAYQTSYMKANFPVIYMAAVLTADAGDVEKIAETINECKRMGLAVLPPDINESFRDFTVVGGGTENEKIRFGLLTIKNLGEGVAHSIIDERKANGKYTSLKNFLDRITDRNLNKKSLEALIKSGALDEFGERGELIHNLENILEYNKQKNHGPKNQDSLFGSVHEESAPLTLEKAGAAGTEEKLTWEKELLGLYVSGHPLDKFREKLESRDFPISKIKDGMKEGMEAVAAGIIEEAKSILTKRGERMMFLKITDFTGSIEAVVFPRVYEEYKDILVLDKCVALKGKISKRDGESSLVVEKAKIL